MYRTYIWVDGDKFDAVQFNDSLGEGLVGRVAYRKQMKGDIVERGNPYWESEIIKVKQGSPIDELAGLLSRYRPALVRLREQPGVRIVAEIVAEYHSLDSIGGLYLSNPIIQLLSDTGASLDIDQYAYFD